MLNAPQWNPTHLLELKQLRLQHVRLRDLANHILDSRRLQTLTCERRLFIVKAEAILVLQQLVEGSADLGEHITFLRLNSRLCDFDIRIRYLRPQLTLAAARKVLAEHEHVLSLVEIPGMAERGSPAAVHERGVIQRARTASTRLNDGHLSRRRVNFGVVGESRRFQLRQGQGDRRRMTVFLRRRQQYLIVAGTVLGLLVASLLFGVSRFIRPEATAAKTEQVLLSAHESTADNAPAQHSGHENDPAAASEKTEPLSSLQLTENEQ